MLARRRACSILEPIDKQYELLEATDPEVLHGPPSVVHELAARARARRWRPSELRRIFTSSEALDRGVRERIEDALGAPVIDHYGAAEAFVGWECELRSGYHVNVRSVFVELLDDEAEPVAPGEIGRVVITTLDNAAMPLIRYAIGDMAIAADGPCACGRPGPVLREVLGRRIDLFQLNGRLLSPWGLVARMREVEFVRQFQIVQTEGDAVRVVFSRRDGLERVDPGAIAALAAEELGNDVRVETREVDHIERLASGKYAPAVNLATTPAAVA